MNRSALRGPNRQRLLRALLALSLAGAVFAVAFGTGYRSSAVAQDDGAAYVQKGHTVAHANSASAGIDAEAAKALATGKQTLQVVQVSSGVVYVVNNATGEVTRLPTDSLEPQPVDARPTAPGSVQVVTGGGQTYLLDPGAGRVTLLPSEPTATGRAEVPATGVDQLVVDPAGTAWGYATKSGDLYEIVGGQVRGKRHVAAGGDPAVLTLAGGAPVLYNAATGAATGFGSGQGTVNLAAADGVPSAAGAQPALIVVAVPATAEVVVGDLRDGGVRRVRLDGREGHVFGRSVLLGNRVYVPDFTARQVVILDLGSLRAIGRAQVPGTSPTFELFARDNRIWANDPYADKLVIVGADGRQTVVDKGSGAGVDVSGSPPPTARPSSTASPTASPSASASASPSGAPVPTSTPTAGPPTSPPPPAKVTVPPLVGQDRGAACARLTALKLKCRPVAVPDGAGQTDKVLSTDPKSGASVKVGSTVSVFYRGPAAVPDLTGMTADQACATLVTVRLTCARQPSGLAAKADAVNLVTAQQPPAGAKVATGSAVTVQYPDRVATPAVAGQPVDPGCAAVQAAGLTCQRIDLGSAVGTGQPVGVIVDQSPVGGAGADPAVPVTVKYYGNANTTVPNVVGADPGAACAALQAAALACAPNDTEATTTLGQVHRQSIAAGTVVAAGTPVGYVYQTRGATGLLRFKGPTSNRANFLTTGDLGAPAGWSSQSTLGSVYPAGQTGVAGLIPIYRFCWSSCASATHYYYSGNGGNAAGYERQGEAFRCFNPSGPAPAESRELHALFNGSVWVWAVPGTGEYSTFVGAGFTAADFLVCFIW